MTQKKTKGPSYSGGHTTPRIQVRKDPNEAGWLEAARAAGRHNLAQWIVEVCDAAAAKSKKPSSRS